ncbi:hypothetical protein JZ751_013251 [Albula glossodonta]|uniref:Uncharacterized protein n=1 Tax=Albula glossodonta TaxID=121402 RepID=A0A8T2P5C9_9TELE|nr:hypothetical protein JZ751_013251 [Albula glossodonta]
METVYNVTLTATETLPYRYRQNSHPVNVKTLPPGAALLVNFPSHPLLTRSFFKKQHGGRMSVPLFLYHSQTHTAATQVRGEERDSCSRLPIPVTFSELQYGMCQFFREEADCHPGSSGIFWGGWDKRWQKRVVESRTDKHTHSADQKLPHRNEDGKAALTAVSCGAEVKERLNNTPVTGYTISKTAHL